MYDVRMRLDQGLTVAISRLRQQGGAAGVEERPGTIGDTCLFADEVDRIQASESREIGFVTRALVLERANRLSAALDRMNEGAYGTCAECDEPISLATRRHAGGGDLRAVPTPARTPRSAAPDDPGHGSPQPAKSACWASSRARMASPPGSCPNSH